MSTTEEFISQLSRSGEIVRDWPAWKADLWMEKDVKSGMEEKKTIQAHGTTFFLDYLQLRSHK